MVAIAAIAGIAGGALQAAGPAMEKGPPSAASAMTVNFDAQRDPLNIALAFDAMMMLGNTRGAEEILNRGSPINQFISAVNNSPMSTEARNAAITVAWRMYTGGGGPEAQQDPIARRHEIDAFNEAVGKSGIDQSVLRRLTPHEKWKFDMGVQDTLKTSAASGTAAARTSALTQLANRIQSMERGDTTYAGLRDAAMRTLEVNRDYNYEQQRKDLLATANEGGFNPAAMLGQLEGQRLREATASPIQAAELASTLAQNEDRDFTRLLSYLDFGSNQARQSTTVLNQAALGSAGIAANQISAAESARSGAQPNSTGNALSTAGTGVQDTAGSISSAAMLKSLMGPASSSGAASSVAKPALDYSR